MKKILIVICLTVLMGLNGASLFAGENNLLVGFKGVKWLKKASWFHSNSDFEVTDNSDAGFDVCIRKNEDLTLDGEKLIRIEYWINKETKRFESVYIHYQDKESFLKFVDFFQKILGKESLIFEDAYTEPHIKSYIWEKQQPIHVRVNEQYPWVAFGTMVIKYSGE